MNYNNSRVKKDFMFIAKSIVMLICLFLIVVFFSHGRYYTDQANNIEKHFTDPAK